MLDWAGQCVVGHFWLIGENTPDVVVFSSRHEFWLFQKNWTIESNRNGSPRQHDADAQESGVCPAAEPQPLLQRRAGNALRPLQLPIADGLGRQLHGPLARHGRRSLVPPFLVLEGQPHRPGHLPPTPDGRLRRPARLPHHPPQRTRLASPLAGLRPPGPLHRPLRR